MIRYILRYVLMLPVLLLLANFGGYVFAFYAGPLQDTRGPYASGTIQLPPLLPEYTRYLQGVTQGDWGVTYNNQPVSETILSAAAASLGLVIPALLFSVLLGVWLGVRSVGVQPPRIAGWVTVLATVGLASPAFYIGILFISLSVTYFIWGPSSKPLLPFQGFGWDAHLILPTLALMVQPTVKMARVTSGLLVDELGKQYVLAAISMGSTLDRARSRHAFRNILGAVVQTVASSLRLMVAELIILERLFNWPGLGRLVSTTLVITSRSGHFLDPPLVAALVTALAAFFLVSDLLAGLVVRLVDPRLRGHEGGHK